jgi:hypothetical protein
MEVIVLTVIVLWLSTQRTNLLPLFGTNDISFKVQRVSLLDEPVAIQLLAPGEANLACL